MGMWTRGPPSGIIRERRTNGPAPGFDTEGTVFRSHLMILIALLVPGCTRESDRADRRDGSSARTDSRTSEAEGSAAQVQGTAGGPLRELALTDVERASDEDCSSRLFAERSIDVTRQSALDTDLTSDDVRRFVLRLQQLVDSPDYETAERLYSELTQLATGEWALLNHSLAGTEFQPMAELLQSNGPVDLWLGDDSAAQRHLSLFRHKSDAVRWLAVRSATFDNSEILVGTKFGLQVERYASRARRDQIARSLAMALHDRNAGVRLAALRGLMWCYEEELIGGETLLEHTTVVKNDTDESVAAQAQRVLRGLSEIASADAD